MSGNRREFAVTTADICCFADSPVIGLCYYDSCFNLLLFRGVRAVAVINATRGYNFQAFLLLENYCILFFTLLYAPFSVRYVYDWVALGVVV